MRYPNCISYYFISNKLCWYVILYLTGDVFHMFVYNLCGLFVCKCIWEWYTLLLFTPLEFLFLCWLVKPGHHIFKKWFNVMYIYLHYICLLKKYNINLQRDMFFKWWQYMLLLYLKHFWFYVSCLKYYYFILTFIIAFLFLWAVELYFPPK